MSMTNNAVKCERCGNVNNDNAKFCSSCGSKLKTVTEQTKSETIICSSCGIVNVSSNVICVGCGSELIEPETVVRESSSQQAEKKSDKKNPLLRQVVFLFAVVSIFIIVYEVVTIPNPEIVKGNSASQNQSMPQDHNHTDAGAVQRINEIEKELEVNSTNKELLLEFANRLQDARFYPRAIEAYKKYLALNGTDFDARVDMGICYFESGDIAKAISEIETVVQKNPKHQMAMFNLGVMYLNSNDLQKSNEWFTKCVGVNPSTEIAQRAKQILTQHKLN